MVRGPSNRLENAMDKLERDLLVKQIAHGVDEDPARVSSVKRLIQCLVDQLNLSCPLCAVRASFRQAGVGLLGAAESVGHGHCVAIGAAGRDG